MSSHHPFKKNKSKAGSGNTFRDDMLVIREELTRIFEAERPSDRTRAKKLRSSSLPYCPLQELYLHMKGWIEPPTEQFPMMSYVTIGTMTHELLQNWVPRFAKKIKIIGLWDATSVDCQNDSTTCPFKSKYPIQALDRKGCPKCGKIPHYEEIASNSKFTSHTDWVIQIAGTNRVYVVDIKTTSLTAVRLHDKGQGKFPQKNYIAQTDSYLVQLTPLLTAMGFEVCGSFILYIPRDRPPNYRLVTARSSVTPEFLAETKERLYRVSDGYRAVGKVMEQDTPITKSQVEQIVAAKLCCSKKDYRDNHAPTYDDPCPLLDVCFKRKLLAKVEKARKKHNSRLPGSA